MKWFLFFLSLLALFFANNVLFLVPGNDDWRNFLLAGIAASLAAILAWLSSKRFVREQATRKELLMAPPAVIWCFVMILFLLGGLFKVAASYFAFH